MPEGFEHLKLLPDDILYRRILAPDFDGGEVFPSAFIDRYEKQSFFVARIVHSPRAVLEWFCNNDRIDFKRVVRNPPPTPEMLFDEAGWGIAVVKAADVLSQPGIEVVQHPATQSDIRPDGHLNLSGVKQHSLMLADLAIALSRDACLRP